MNSRYKLVLIFFTVVIFAAICYFYAIKLASVSIQDEFKKFETEQVTDNLDIFTDQFNIPHIAAKNETDAFFAVGYLHAKDRLWQMDFMRRFGRGELAEIFGEDYIYVDKFARSLGIVKVTNRIIASIDPQTKKILEAYAKGVNFYLKEHSKTLPFEFNALTYVPTAWKIEDCIVIGRILAFNQSGGFFNDITFGEISERIGVDKALKLMPTGKFDGIAQMDSTFAFKVAKVVDTLKPIVIDTNIKKTAEILREFSKSLNDLKSKMNLKGSEIGSNSWAIRKNKNATNSPAVLSSDPHMDFTIPANWYQLHISSPKLNLVGLTIPGVPFPFIGRNNNISWGMTNAMIDDVDYFIEKIDSVDKNFYYLPSGAKAKFEFRKDTIKVKGKNPEVYYQRFTKNTCVISDFHLNRNPKLNYNNDNNKIFEKYALTYSWTGNYKSDESTALYKICYSKDWQSFVSATETWGAPGIVFSYADTKGNIGLNPSGFTPIRKLNSPNMPSPSWLPDYAWEGIRNSSQLPKQYNPAKGFVVTANNKLSKNIPFYFSNNSSTHSRAERISEVLSQFVEYNVRDAQLLQNDFYSNYSKELLEYALPILEKNSSGMSDIEKRGVMILKYWDNFLAVNDAAGSIYSAFLVNLIKNIYYDDLGDWLFKQYTRQSSFPLKRTYEILHDTLDTFIDDVRTPTKENKEFIVVDAYKKGIQEMHKFFDDDNIYEWKYGKLHQLTLKHQFSENLFFKPAVTIGPYQIGGDVTTVNNSEYKFSNPYSVVLGSSARFIADMEDSLVYSVIPGGVSGEPLSNNYSDQLQIWLSGGYIKTSILSKQADNEKLSISFIPKK